MNEMFYISAVVAGLSTLMAITRLNAVHALLYIIVSFFAVAVIFFLLGAPFVAVLEIIIYAGAIIVLFVFVVMMLNLGPRAMEQEKLWLTPGIWTGPTVLALVLAVELIFLLPNPGGLSGAVPVGPKAVGIALFGPYILGVELASILLLAGLVGAYHLGRRKKKEEPHGGGS
jgi:NADH-quinone oxidoreductase subunit J